MADQVGHSSKTKLDYFNKIGFDIARNHILGDSCSPSEHNLRLH